MHCPTIVCLACYASCCLLCAFCSGCLFFFVIAVLYAAACVMDGCPFVGVRVFVCGCFVVLVVAIVCLVLHVMCRLCCACFALSVAVVCGVCVVSVVRFFCACCRCVFVCGSSCVWLFCCAVCIGCLFGVAC